MAQSRSIKTCSWCKRTPHGLECPKHPTYDDPTVLYERIDIPKKERADETWTAQEWVEGTFKAAALDAEEREKAAALEGISEFEKAIKDGWIAAKPKLDTFSVKYRISGEITILASDKKDALKQFKATSNADLGVNLLHGRTQVEQLGITEID